MYYSIIIISAVVVIAGLYINARAYNKGVEAGRLQVLEEDLIRMDKTQRSGLDKKIEAFYKQFETTKNHSR